jgi:hypothetical protein
MDDGQGLQMVLKAEIKESLPMPVVSRRAQADGKPPNPLVDHPGKKIIPSDNGDPEKFQPPLCPISVQNSMGDRYAAHLESVDEHARMAASPKEHTPPFHELGWTH